MYRKNVCPFNSLSATKPSIKLGNKGPTSPMYWCALQIYKGYMGI